MLPDITTQVPLPRSIMELMECTCPSCRSRFFEKLYEGQEHPPLAYQFGKKKIYYLLCSYCTRLKAAPAFAKWALDNLASGEMEKPKKKRQGKMP